jgi:hypothetical protein
MNAIYVFLSAAAFMSVIITLHGLLIYKDKDKQPCPDFPGAGDFQEDSFFGLFL